MELENLNEYIKFIKQLQSLKSEFIKIHGNIIYGIDKEFNTLKISYINNKFIYDGTISSAFLSNVISLDKEIHLLSKMNEKELKIYLIDNCPIYDRTAQVQDIYNNYYKSLISQMSNIEYINDIKLDNIFIHMISNVSNIIGSSKVIFSESDMKSRDDFNELLSMKSTEGAGLLKISPKIIMTFFKGLIPINASDKVALNVYHVNDSKFLSEFIINKGKGVIIKEYIMYLYI